MIFIKSWMYHFHWPSTAFDGINAPRGPSFNHVEDPTEAKHWLVRRQPRYLFYITIFTKIVCSSTWEWSLRCKKLAFNQSVIPLKFLSRPLNSTLVSKVDEVFRNRWRTLLSVDDMVDEILQCLSNRNLLQKTVVIFTSDHGYHLGNYGLPLDKRMPYDTGKYLHEYLLEDTRMSS